jgi:hypothetical protein
VKIFKFETTFKEKFKLYKNFSFTHPCLMNIGLCFNFCVFQNKKCYSEIQYLKILWNTEMLVPVVDGVVEI